MCTSASASTSTSILRALTCVYLIVVVVIQSTVAISQPCFIDKACTSPYNNGDSEAALTVAVTRSLVSFVRQCTAQYCTAQHCIAQQLRLPLSRHTSHCHQSQRSSCDTAVLRTIKYIINSINRLITYNQYLPSRRPRKVRPLAKHGVCVSGGSDNTAKYRIANFRIQHLRSVSLVLAYDDV